MPAKTTHLMQWRDKGTGTTKAECGRLVNWMNTRDTVEGVTCPKCHVIASRKAIADLTAVEAL